MVRACNLAQGHAISLDLETAALKMSADLNRTEIPSSVSSKALLYESLKPSICKITKVHSTLSCNGKRVGFICFRKSNESTLYSFSFSSILG